MTSSAGERLAGFVNGLDLAAVPDRAREAARRQLVDGLGCALAAVRLGEGAAVRSTANLLGGSLQATRLDGLLSNVTTAALVNGFLIHALDYDDTHGGALVHATAVTLPAALATGEMTGSSGAEVLEAAIAGYEVVARLGMVVPHGFHRRGLHATSVCGVMSAALVAGRLLRLTHSQLVAALGIAGSMASGSLEFLSDGSSTKQLHPGLASQSGVLAALLAQRGATGPATILEGPSGIFRALANTTVHADDIVAGLGEQWEVEVVTAKPLPICQLSMASLAAVGALRGRLNGRDVNRMTVGVPAAAVPIVLEPVVSKLLPRSTYEAKFSLQWCAAVLLIDGAITVDTFTPSTLDRADVRSLAARVVYTVTAWDGPAAAAPGSLRAELSDGSIEGIDLTGSHDPVSDAPGGDAIRAKFFANCGDAVDATRLYDLVMRMEHLDRISELTAILRDVREPVG